MEPGVLRSAFGEGRVTPQRRLIAQVAAGMPGAFTVDELALAVRTAGAGGAGSLNGSGAQATVYRAVAALESSGFLVRVGSRDGSSLFVCCPVGAHHHHIVCDGCGRVAHTSCPLDAHAAPAEGFVVTRHEIALYGLCPACARDTDGS